jgi:hypothetical protein
MALNLFTVQHWAYKPLFQGYSEPSLSVHPSSCLAPDALIMEAATPGPKMQLNSYRFFSFCLVYARLSAAGTLMLDCFGWASNSPPRRPEK